MNFYQSAGSEGKYYDIWWKAVPEILTALERNSSLETVKMKKKAFLIASNRTKFTFTIKLIDCQVTNNLSGSAVARDLADILTRNGKLSKALQSGQYNFSMDKNFILTISKI